MKTYTFSFQDKDSNILKEEKCVASNRKHSFEIRDRILANSRMNDLYKIVVK